MHLTASIVLSYITHAAATIHLLDASFIDLITSQISSTLKLVQ